MDLALYLLLGISTAAFLLLEAGDLGGGVLSLLFRDEEERYACLRPALPLTDGAELWLLLCCALVAFGLPLFGRALAGVFGRALAGVFGVHLLLLLLLGLVRFVFTKIRLSTFSEKRCETADRVRGVCGALILFLGGFLLATLLCGSPVNADGRFSGQVSALFRPYAFLGGICALLSGVLFATPLVLRDAEEVFAARVKRIQAPLWLASLFAAAVFLGWTIALPQFDGAFRRVPVWIALAFAVLGLSQLSALTEQGKIRAAVLSARVSLVGHVLLFFALSFPYLMTSASGDGMDAVTLASALAGKKVLAVLVPVAGGAAVVLAVFSFLAVRRAKRAGI